MEQLTHYDGQRVLVIKLFDDDSYRIHGTDGVCVEMGDATWLMSAWGRNILKEARELYYA